MRTIQLDHAMVTSLFQTSIKHTDRHIVTDTYKVAYLEFEDSSFYLVGLVVSGMPLNQDFCD